MDKLSLVAVTSAVKRKLQSRGIFLEAPFRIYLLKHLLTDSPLVLGNMSCL